MQPFRRIPETTTAEVTDCPRLMLELGFLDPNIWRHGPLEAETNRWTYTHFKARCFNAWWYVCLKVSNSLIPLVCRRDRLRLLLHLVGATRRGHPFWPRWWRTRGLCSGVCSDWDDWRILKILPEEEPFSYSGVEKLRDPEDYRLHRIAHDSDTSLFGRICVPLVQGSSMPPLGLLRMWSELPIGVPVSCNEYNLQGTCIVAHGTSPSPDGRVPLRNDWWCHNSFYRTFATMELNNPQWFWFVPKGGIYNLGQVMPCFPAVFSDYS